MPAGKLFFSLNHNSRETFFATSTIEMRVNNLQFVAFVVLFLVTKDKSVGGFPLIKLSTVSKGLSRHQVNSGPAVKGTKDNSMDPLDPLEDAPQTAESRRRQTIFSKPKNLNPIPKVTIRKPSSKSDEKKGFSAKKKSESDTDCLSLDQKILLSQAEILRTLPLDFFLSFRNLCEQVVPRFGIYTLTFHVILLIPIIRIVKFQLNASIYPFLYIGPILFLVPYLFFWIWENDVAEVPVFDQRLLKYVQKQKDAATKILDKERNELMLLAKNSDSQETIKKLANLTLMSTIDVENFMSEIISIKKRIKGRAEKNPTLATFSQDIALVSDKQVNFNDDVNSAVKTLIETSLLGQGNESEKSLLEKLKQLQKDLDKSA